MSISSQVFAGGVYQRNRTSWAITTTSAVPAGAVLWLIMGSSIADDSVLTITDSAGNQYPFPQVALQQPGVTGTLFAYIVPNCLALPVGSTITINSNNRGDMLASLYYVTGAYGAVYSTDVEYSQGTQPSATVQSYTAGMGLFGVVMVAGPNNDGFTQAPGWGTDITPNITTLNATIHTGFKFSSGTTPETYAPTLGASRQNVVFLASFT